MQNSEYNFSKSNFIINRPDPFNYPSPNRKDLMSLSTLNS